MAATGPNLWDFQLKVMPVGGYVLQSHHLVRSSEVVIICPRTLAHAHMVVSQNRGNPIYTPKYYNPYSWDPQNGTPNFGKPPYQLLQDYLAILHERASQSKKARLWSFHQGDKRVWGFRGLCVGILVWGLTV